MTSKRSIVKQISIKTILLLTGFMLLLVSSTAGAKTINLRISSPFPSDHGLFPSFHGSFG